MLFDWLALLPQLVPFNSRDLIPIDRPDPTRADDSVELAEDLAREEAVTAEAGAPLASRRVRRNVVGPFSLRQVTIAISVVMAAAIVFTLATVPITQLVPNLPVPDPSAYLFGSPIPGSRSATSPRS